MDRPAIVIRDIHHYGDDLTVPEAIARLCDGGQVTVTVTDPAPPGGDPRGNPRHGFDITVRPALGRQPELPPEISWEARTFETPDSAALFAEALTLASQLADLAGLGGGQAVPGQAAAIGAAHGRDAARRALALATPAACRDIIAPAGDRRPDGPRPVRHARAGRPARHPLRHRRPGRRPRPPPGRRPQPRPGRRQRPANGRGGVLHRRRRSLLGRGRTHRPRPRRPAPRHQQPARRGMKPRAGRKPGHPGPLREN